LPGSLRSRVCRVLGVLGQQPLEVRPIAIVAQTGNVYNGLWYPIVVASMTFIVGMLFIRETKDVDIYKND